MTRRGTILLALLVSARLWGHADDFDTALTQGIDFLKQDQTTLAADKLEAALRLSAVPSETAEAVGWLGLAQIRLRRPDLAEAQLARAIASGSGEPRDRARWMAGLAELEAGSGRIDDAGHHYADALSLAAGDPALTAGIRLSQARFLPPDRKIAALRRIAESLSAIEPPAERGRYLVNLGVQAGTLQDGGESLARESFEQAGRIPGTAPRVRAEALAGLAKFEHGHGRLDEAEKLYAEAIRAANAVGANDLLADMEWQSGRIMRALGRTTEALAAYRRAAEHMEEIRADLPIEYIQGRSSRRDAVGPLYLEYADLLFESADREGNSRETTRLLKEARDAVESIKVMEMEDFLGDRCGVPAPAKKAVDSVDPGTAVLYPIVFPHRLELLVSSGEEFHRFTRKVEASDIQREAKKLADSLRDRRPDFMAPARELHRSLIAPAEPWLRQRRIKILVIVPDGALRRIPLAVLHDGERYLVERYAIATSPGLKLFDRASRRPEPIALLAGMSRPGPVVDRLPNVFYEALLLGGGNERSGGEGVRPQRAVIESLQRDRDFRRDVSEKMILPGVDREIGGLEREIRGRVMLNEQFTVGGLARELGNRSYSIVHIAAHGFFGPTPKTSFIVAFDDVVDIDAFESMFKSQVARNRPVDLLVLSACQTAEGDDHFPLGISGVALKGNVRSALGSLWPVSDTATSRLMIDFYEALRRPENSKVEALCQAQRKLLADPAFRDPYYWAPFILVGNWL